MDSYTLLVYNTSNVNCTSTLYKFTANYWKQLASIFAARRLTSDTYCTSVFTIALPIHAVKQVHKTNSRCKEYYRATDSQSAHNPVWRCQQLCRAFARTLAGKCHREEVRTTELQLWNVSSQYQYATTHSWTRYKLRSMLTAPPDVSTSPCCSRFMERRCAMGVSIGALQRNTVYMVKNSWLHTIHP